MHIARPQTLRIHTTTAPCRQSRTTHRHAHSLIVASSAPPSQTTSIPEQLPSEALDAWTTCSTRLTTLGVPAEKVDLILKKSFGWSGQGFWRGEVENVVPTVEKIDAVLNFLSTDLNITSEADQSKLITTFPEVLGLSLDLMKDNVEKMKTKFFLKGATLTGSVKRKPRVLGAVVDCEGTCEGWCTRCFVQF